MKLGKYLSSQDLCVAEKTSIDDTILQPPHRKPDVIVILAEKLDRQIYEFVSTAKVGKPDVGLMILSDTPDVVERVLALEMGVDDLVSSECAPREVLARIHRLIRRYSKEDRKIATTAPIPALDMEGAWILDERTRVLTSPTGKPCGLPKTSVGLLKELIERAAPNDNREGQSQWHNSVQLRTSISRIRRRLLAAGIRDEFIRNERGRGYVLCKEVRLVADNVQ